MSVEEVRCLASPAVDSDDEDVGPAVVTGGVEVLPFGADRPEIDVSYDESFLPRDRLHDPAAARSRHSRTARAVVLDSRLLERGP